jgi:hypothetical protein
MVMARWSRLIAAAGLIVSPIVVAGGLSPASATHLLPRGTAPPELLGVSLQIVDQTMTVAPGGTLDLVIEIDGTVPEDHHLVVIGYREMNSRIATQTVIRGGRDLNNVSVVDLGPPGALPVNEAGQLAISIGTTTDAEDTTRLLINQPGLYPVGVALRDPRGTPKNEQLGFFEQLAEGASPSPIRIGVAVHIDGPPSLQPSGTWDVSDEVTAEIEALLDLLASTPFEVDIAIRPELLDGLALSDDPNDRVRLDALAVAVSQRHRVLSLPYVSLDPATAAVDGLNAVFTEQLRRGEETIRERLGVGGERSVWLIDSGIETAGTDMLRNLGVQYMLVGADLVVSTGPASSTSGTLGRIAGLTDVPVLMADAALRPSDDAQASDASVAQVARMLAADVYAIGIEGDDTSSSAHSLVVIETDLTADDVAELGTLAKYLDQHPRVSFDPPSEIVRAADRATDVVDRVQMTLVAPTAVPSLELAEVLIRLRNGIDTTSSMLPVNDPRIDRWNAIHRVVVSGQMTTGERSTYVAQLDGELGELREDVRLAEAPKFNLGGEESLIPLALESTSKTPLSVIVRFTSPNDKVTFPKNDIPLVVSGRREFEVAVKVRSSGQTAVLVQILTPSGPDDARELVGATRLSISTTVFSGVGQWVTWGFLGILVVWWVHHARKTRRNKRASLEHATRSHPATTLTSS